VSQKHWFLTQHWHGWLSKRILQHLCTVKVSNLTCSMYVHFLITHNISSVQDYIWHYKWTFVFHNSVSYCIVLECCKALIRCNGLNSGVCRWQTFTVTVSIHCSGDSVFCMWHSFKKCHFIILAIGSWLTLWTTFMPLLLVFVFAL
jgi:hypothetical protein